MDKRVSLTADFLMICNFRGHQTCELSSLKCLDVWSSERLNLFTLLFVITGAESSNDASLLHRFLYT